MKQQKVTIAALILLMLANLASSSHQYYYDEPDEYALDIGIKLKREYADDLVSDLFATSYGLEKVARV